MIPLLGFAPDADPTVPGVLIDCVQVIPYESGFRTAPAPVSVGLAAVAADTRGAAIAISLASAATLYVGTAAKLYKAGSTTYTDVSRVANYTLGTDDRWSFCQFGDSTLASNITCVIQKAVAGSFADIAAAPKARIIEQSLGFVMAFGTDEGTYGVSPDRWWCSATFDETNWTPAVSTQCATGRLVSSPGPITAGKRFGDDIIAYKSRSIYVGRYQGPPAVWDFDQVTYDVGCVGIDAVVDTSIGHVFVGLDDIYVYDGTVPRSIADGITKQWFNANCNPTYRYRTRLVWDKANSLVWIFFPSAGNTDCDSGLVYHTGKRQWGRSNQVVQTAVSFITPSVTYNGGSAVVTTYDAGPSVSFDSLFWMAGASIPAIIGTDKIVKTLTGATTTSSFTTGDFGVDEGSAECTGFVVRYNVAPTSATATGIYKSEGGGGSVSGTPGAKTDGKFDIRQSGRWHRFQIDMVGPAQFTAIQPKLQPHGAR